MQLPGPTADATCHFNNIGTPGSMKVKTSQKQSIYLPFMKIRLIIRSSIYTVYCFVIPASVLRSARGPTSLPLLPSFCTACRSPA